MLAFDYGGRRTGVAVGQTITGSARALTTLTSVGTGPDWAAIDRLLDEWRPDLLLVGLPQRDDGSDSPQTLAARAFARELEERGIRVALVNEHLTSNEASRALAEARSDGSRRRRVRKEDIDALAAVLIAEQWLRAAPDEI